MTDRPSLQSQIDALESHVLSRQGFLDRCETLMQDPKHKARLEYEYACTKGSQPALEALLQTARWLRDDPEFRALIERRRAAA